MRIGELAEKAGVSNDTLRFYESKGLIRSIRRMNGYREYSEEMLFILNYIRTAQRLGFTLSEIGEEIPVLLEGGITQERIAAILKEKITVTEKKIEELRQLRNELQQLLNASCPLLPPGGSVTRSS